MTYETILLFSSILPKRVVKDHLSYKTLNKFCFDNQYNCSHSKMVQVGSKEVCLNQTNLGKRSTNRKRPVILSILL